MRFLSTILLIMTLTHQPILCAETEPAAAKTSEHKRFTPEEVAKILRLIDTKKLAKKKKLKRSKNFKRYLMILLMSISLEIIIEAWWQPSTWFRNRAWPDKIPPTPAPAADLAKANADILALQEQLAAYIAAQEKVPAQQQQIYAQILDAKLAPQLQKMREFEAVLAELRKDLAGQKDTTSKAFASTEERIKGAEHTAETSCQFTKEVIAKFSRIEADVQFNKTLDAISADQKKKTLSATESARPPSSSSSSSNASMPSVSNDSATSS